MAGDRKSNNMLFIFFSLSSSLLYFSMVKLREGEKKIVRPQRERAIVSSSSRDGGEEREIGDIFLVKASFFRF